MRICTIWPIKPFNVHYICYILTYITCDDLLRQILSIRKPQNKKLQEGISLERGSDAVKCDDDHPCKCEEMYQLYMTISVRCCTILHKNDAFKVCALFMLRNCEILQHIMVPLSSDGKVLDSFADYHFVKIWSIDKFNCESRTHFHLSRFRGCSCIAEVFSHAQIR